MFLYYFKSMSLEGINLSEKQAFTFFCKDVIGGVCMYVIFEVFLSYFYYMDYSF